MQSGNVSLYQPTSGVTGFILERVFLRNIPSALRTPEGLKTQGMHRFLCLENPDAPRAPEGLTHKGISISHPKCMILNIMQRAALPCTETCLYLFVFKQFSFSGHGGPSDGSCWSGILVRILAFSFWILVPCLEC